MEDVEFYNMSDDPLMDYEHYAGILTERRIITAVASSLLIVAGCITNIACAAVFARREMRAIPVYYGLLLVSLADVFMLVFVLGHEWLHATFQINLSSMSHAYCVIFNVTYSVVSDLTGILVVVIALCHCCCACCCSRASRSRSRETGVGPAFCRFPIIYVWTAFFVVFCVLSNTYVAWYVDMGEWFEGHVVCYHYFDAIKHFLKPVLLQFIVVCLIPYLIYLAFCRRDDSVSSSSSSGSRGGRRGYPLSFPSPPSSPHSHTSLEEDGEQQQQPVDDEEIIASRLSLTILALCVAFLATNLPITFITFLTILFYHEYNIASVLTSLLWYSYFAFKIIIYLLTAPDFRHALKRMIINRAPRSESREAIAMLES